jgi:Mn-containing catalase
MYHHVKKLMYTVNIDRPDVLFGRMLLEQFGGANGELAAAMQYTIQGWNCVDDLGRRDLLLDIGTEELSHLEVVGALIRMHLAPLKMRRPIRWWRSRAEGAWRCRTRWAMRGRRSMCR